MVEGVFIYMFTQHFLLLLAKFWSLMLICRELHQLLIGNLISLCQNRSERWSVVTSSVPTGIILCPELIYTAIVTDGTIKQTEQEAKVNIVPQLFLLKYFRSMLSQRQARVWRYVESGSLLKLKSYLRKHRDLDVNFTRGKKQRSPLHLACSLGDDAVLRLLLKHGADVLQQDRRGQTALHIAANKALKHGKTSKKQ